MALESPDLCHKTVDTDCLLAALLTESQTDNTGGQAVAAAFEGLGVSKDALALELTRARPSEQLPPSVFPVHYDVGGRSVGYRVATGRLILIQYRSRDEAWRQASSGTQQGVAEPVHALYGLLCEDTGPAARAFEAVGVPPAAARQILGIPQPSVHHSLPALWPIPRQPGEIVDGRKIPDLLLHPAPDPQPGLPPSGFAWTGNGQELAVSAGPDGSIRLTVRDNTQIVVDLCSEVAEYLIHVVQSFCYQVNAERWEPQPDRRTTTALRQ